MAKATLAFTILLIGMLVVASHVDAAIDNCSQVTPKVVPCASFLINGGNVSPTCCTGIKGLLALAKTTKDRRTACDCLKKGAAQIPNLKLDNAAALPGKCGVSIPYKISPTTDCSKVN